MLADIGKYRPQYLRRESRRTWLLRPARASYVEDADAVVTHETAERHDVVDADVLGRKM